MAGRVFATLATLATLAACAPVVEERQACNSVWWDSILSYFHIHTNADIGLNAEARAGLEQHAVLLVAHVSTQTPFTHNVSLALEARARLHSLRPPTLRPPTLRPRQLSRAVRLLHQVPLRQHHRLDQELLLTRVIHFPE